jgi:GNAT superfamily N-acetyltransferase
MSLLLTPEQHRALVQIVGVASPDDFERTYSFAHPLNARRGLKRARVDSQISGTRFRWHLLFFEAGGACILEDEKPVSRSVSVAELVSVQTRGLVVSNETLYLDAQYQSKGFARALYAAELELHGRWGVREVWLRAQREGLLVWMRREFGFRPTDPGALRKRYKFWLGSTPPEDPIEYPEAFLRQLQDVQLFKVIP